MNPKLETVKILYIKYKPKHCLCLRLCAIGQICIRKYQKISDLTDKSSIFEASSRDCEGHREESANSDRGEVSEGDCQNETESDIVFNFKKEFNKHHLSPSEAVIFTLPPPIISRHRQGTPNEEGLYKRP